MTSIYKYLRSTLPLRDNYFKSPEQVGTKLDPSNLTSKPLEYDVIIVGVSISCAVVWYIEEVKA